MRRVVVTDTADPLLDGFRDLRDPERRRRREGRDGVFVAEGVAVVGRLVRSSYPALAIVVVPEREGAIVAEIAGVDGLDAVVLAVVERSVLDAVAGFPVHRGVLALGARRPFAAVGELDPTVRTTVVLEDCNDHENMGAVARSARALDADAMVLSPRCADPLYRRSVRVSMGEILRLPIAVADGWPSALDELREQGFRVLALTPADDADVLDEVEVEPGERIAVLLGAEGPGLSGPALAAADQRVRIPVTPGVDSLNLGHAAAVALHHIAAARRDSATPGAP